MLAVLCWLSTFAITLPSAAIVFSLLWPVTRRRTAAATWLCLTAGAATGILLAPLTSPKLHGTSPLQLATFALIGAAVAALYRVLLNRLSRDD
jgi:ABC-type Fe3+-siderophore transport system permease subunit